MISMYQDILTDKHVSGNSIIEGYTLMINKCWPETTYYE